MIHRFWKFLSAILLLIVIVVVALYLTIDSIAKAGVEKGGTYALGVNTRVDSVGVSLLRGRLGMEGIEIDNPKGYRSALLLRSGSLDADVKTGTLFSQVIEIPLIEVDNIEVNVERRSGGNNIRDVVNHIHSLGSGAKTEGGRRVKIDIVRLKNVTAKVQLLGLGGDASTVTVRIPELELKNVTEDNAEGIVVGELMARLFPAIIAGVVEKGKGILPADLVGELSADVAKAAGALGEGGGKLIRKAGETVGKAGEGLRDAAKGVGKTIDDLFGKKKDE